MLKVPLLNNFCVRVVTAILEYFKGTLTFYILNAGLFLEVLSPYFSKFRGFSYQHPLLLLILVVLLYSNRLLITALVLPLFNRHGSVREQCLTELLHSV